MTPPCSQRTGKNHIKKLQALAAEGDAKAAAELEANPPAPKASKKRKAAELDADGNPVEPKKAHTLRTADASSQSKSVLNELVQQKGWRATYVHHRRGSEHEPEFQAVLTLERKQQPPEQHEGNWTFSKKMAEMSAAAACLQALEENNAKEELTLTSNKQSGRVPASRLRFFMINAASGDELLMLVAQHLRAPPPPPPPPLQPACHDDLAAATRARAQRTAHFPCHPPSVPPLCPLPPQPPFSALSLSLALSVSRAHLPRASQPTSAQSTTHARGTTSPTSCAAAAGTMGSRSAIGSRASPT